MATFPCHQTKLGCDTNALMVRKGGSSELDCTYKCHLLLNGRHGNKTEYEEHTERLDNMYQRAAIAILQEMHPNKDIIFLHELTPDTFDNDARVFIIMHAEANGLKSDWIVLTRGKHTLGSCQPVLFHRGEEINTITKLLLAFRSVLIEKVTGIVLSYGQIIYGPDFSSVTISLSTFITKVKGMLCRVDELATQPLNRIRHFFSVLTARFVNLGPAAYPAQLQKTA